MSTPTTPRVTLEPRVTPEKVAVLAREVIELTEAYELVHREANSVRAGERAALNRLNGAQKALDRAAASLRESAPQGSAWGQESCRGEQREATPPVILP